MLCGRGQPTTPRPSLRMCRGATATRALLLVRHLLSPREEAMREAWQQAVRYGFRNIVS